MATDERPTIAVIALGGTIAMTASADGPGARPSLTAEDLLAAVPGLDAAGVTVQARTFRSVPGASLSFADLTELVRLIDSLSVDSVNSVDGVVVTQGTDTLEETAYFLDIALGTLMPVVVTGAMRNPSLAGADGPANLLAAVQAAAAPASRGLGTLVVMADEVHAARRVRKTHTTSIAAFTSPDTGPIGHLVEGRVRYLAHPGDRTWIGSGDLPANVALVTAAFGDDFPLLRPVRADLDGLVVGAFGVGHVPAETVDLLGEYAARIPVVLASRTGAGAIHHASYGFPGSEHDLQRHGLLNAGFLDPLKARILLRQLLATGASRDTIAATFAALDG
ncbi:MAG: Asparaginase/glutaminase [Amycolatopsis sp.]|uniref:asparaginase n=1 Tax=Amycolatopsis sp. TaxID=37632 RepID=UPI00261344DA|nr:asparaginase [Amycolatopsis sp.]MCU1680348.1 Asparaginase/glutaminase [Amycolatopsis sp.]